MNFFEEDEYLDFDPWDCGEDCPFMRQQFGPYGPPTQPPFGPGGGPHGHSQHGPGFGPPPFGPGGGQQFGPGGGGGPQGGPPQGAPPKSIPQQSQAKTFGMGGPGGPGVYAVDPGAIRPCMYRYVYLWLRNGQQFWAWLTYVGRTSAAGWRWNGRRWIYFGTDLRRIENFYCY